MFRGLPVRDETEAYCPAAPPSESGLLQPLTMTKAVGNGASSSGVGGHA